MGAGTSNVFERNQPQTTQGFRPAVNDVGRAKSRCRWLKRTSMNDLSRKKGLMMVASKLRPRPAALLSRPSELGRETRRIWAILYFAVKRFLLIGGAQWAGAFAFNSFFSLFPLMVLLVTIASFFITATEPGKR